MYELALFAGAGGGILGGKLLGWRTICAVERDKYAASVLIQRQNDGHLEPFPVWSDVCTFDGRPWAGRVDVVSGGFPCQDISSAGKGEGIEGARSGLWMEMARIIGEVRPRFVFVENSPALTSRGLGRVLGDLASMGFDAEWGVVGAHHAGAPHKRDRIWIVACNPNSDSKSVEPFYGEALGVPKLATNSTVERLEGHRPDAGKQAINQSWDVGGEVSDSNGHNDALQGDHEEGAESLLYRSGDPGGSQRNSWEGHIEKPGSIESHRHSEAPWWQDEIESGVGRVAHGVACRVDRLRAIGNGQVPAVAALAWETLKQRLEEEEG